MKRSVSSLPLCVALLLGSVGLVHAQTQPPIPQPDERFKTDILLVVAHPDDDTAASTYLAKAVFDENRRVAVVFTTRGNSGPNAVGMEQSKALSDVRETEARHSLAARGISNVWFLDGQDTPTQDVLHSLETMGHGAALEDLVRLVRLTRPEVVLTWLPAYVAGENHGDHQASSVLATEAFDLANVPTWFPEQLEAPRVHSGTANYGEGLQPWQAKKLYYFSDATHPDYLLNRGPRYLASETSRTKHVPYSEMNRIAWENYATQVDFDAKTLKYFIDLPDQFILGKSFVPAAPLGDVMEGAGKPLTPGADLPPEAISQPTGITMQLGGPWHFYRQFYAAHRLDSLKALVPPETSLGTDRQLWVPLLLENKTTAAEDVTISSNVPNAWKQYTGPGTYHLEPGANYPVQVFLIAPPDSSGVKSPQLLTWTAAAGAKTIATVSLNVYLEFDGVGQ